MLVSSRQKPGKESWNRSFAITQDGIHILLEQHMGILASKQETPACYNSSEALCVCMCVHPPTDLRPGNGLETWK